MYVYYFWNTIIPQIQNEFFLNYIVVCWESFEKTLWLMDFNTYY